MPAYSKLGTRCGFLNSEIPKLTETWLKWPYLKHISVGSREWGCAWQLPGPLIGARQKTFSQNR